MMKNKLKITLFWLLSLTWGLALTLLGFIFLLINLLTLSITDVKIVEGRIVFRSRLMFGGICLGGFIFVSKDAGIGIVYHEIGHSVQNILWGLLFLPVIGIPSIVCAAIGIKNYEDLWFERQATTIGNKIRLKI